MTGNARWRSWRLRYKAAAHVPTGFWSSRSRSRAVARGCKKVNPLEIWRHICIGSDSSGAETRESKSGAWAAVLWQGRRLRHLAFLIMFTYSFICNGKEYLLPLTNTVHISDSRGCSMAENRVGVQVRGNFKYWKLVGRHIGSSWGGGGGSNDWWLMMIICYCSPCSPETFMYSYRESRKNFLVQKKSIITVHVISVVSVCMRQWNWVYMIYLLRVKYCSNVTRSRFVVLWSILPLSFFRWLYFII